MSAAQDRSFRPKRRVSKPPPWAIRAMHLWRRQNADGSSFLSGSAGGLRVLIFKNEMKQTADDPDYLLCYAPRLPGGVKDPAEYPIPELLMEDEL